MPKKILNFLFVKNISTIFKYKKYIKKISIIIFLIISFLSQLKYNKNIKIVINYNKYIPNNLNYKSSEKEKLYNFFHLKKKPINPKDPLIIKEKKELLKKISNIKKKKIKSIKYVYLAGKMHFGNFLISLNNAIFFCEILGCKKLFIQNYQKLYLKNKIIDKKYNLSIEPANFKSLSLKNIIVLRLEFFFYFHKYIKNEINFSLFKNELLLHLPKIKTFPNDLYIHIRSGDIFATPRNNSYSQPPLCFYEKVLNKFKFRKVFIISQKDNNPVINKILNKYDNVIYNKNLLIFDIAYLINSFNIVQSTSSFLLSIIKLNDKLKVLFEYDIYRLSEKFLHLHYSVYHFPFNYTIYQMKPSRHYQKFMYIWFNSPEQRKLMINEKCKSNFIIINPFSN